MSKNTRISTELRSVETLIKKDFSKEETISGLYKYIFKSNGKKINELNLNYLNISKDENVALSTNSKDVTKMAKT